MICNHCKNVVHGSATVCEHCGKSLLAGTAGDAGKLRQGRSQRPVAHAEGSVREMRYDPLLPDAPLSTERRPRSQKHARDAQDAGKPDSRRGLLREQSKNAVPISGRRDKHPRVHKIMVNWAMVGLVLVFVFLFALMGGYLYLKTTDDGQLILARMGQDVNATALWSLGTEYLDQGYIEKSIQAYEAAYEQEPDREDVYEKLLLLAEAYEAGGYQGLAEEVYVKLYTELDPANTTAYSQRIRLLSDQGRLPELADFLKFAYEQTGSIDYAKQREDLLPSSPTVQEPASTYRLTEGTYKEIHLESAEGYDMYYILNGSETDTLPEAGTLYTEPIKLYEGTYNLRAVAISSELVSDEISANYTVALPVPEAPRSSLAPDTYETRQRVYLRYPDEDAENITIYYTIDGQSPTANSPIYTGEPVVLPGGRVTIKAVAVNEHGKVSNEMSVEVKINISFKRYYNENDTFSGFELLTTTYDQFIKKYGEPVEEVEITDVMPGTCLKLSYSWGECKFYLGEKGYVLYALETSSASMGGPRGTKVGLKEKDVTDKFRDMGQTYDQNGDRSIYYDDAEGYAKLYKMDDDSSRIDYVYYTEDGGSMYLSYTLHSGLVVRVGTRYEP